MSKKTNRLKSKVRNLEQKIENLENLIIYLRQTQRPNQLICHYHKEQVHPITFEFLQEYFANRFMDELKNNYIDIKDCGNFYQGSLNLGRPCVLSRPRGRQAAMMEIDGVDVLKK